ncbi:hypothetical protein VP1G_10866 [Cytospora mali]|uniref:Uncharacterized protein n=1 Tax=Cytospora mali TaxID=578113 RepID=A0A194UXX1_CYTMA|nr:hypothetical protein VP1G_10866 [Valsa mali var. pyri (nom. inval.)]
MELQEGPACRAGGLRGGVGVVGAVVVVGDKSLRPSRAERRAAERGERGADARRERPLEVEAAQAFPGRLVEDERGLDREVVRQAAPQLRVPLRHAHPRVPHHPAADRAVLELPRPRAREDVVQPLAPRAAIRMQDPPHVPHRRTPRDDPVRRRQRRHVEVPRRNDQVAPLGRAAQHLGQLPGLRLPVHAVRVGPVGAVRRVRVRVEHLEDVLVARAVAHPRAGYPLPDVPVPAPEGRRPPVEAVGHHGGLLDGPLGQDGQAAAEGAREVELAVREEVVRFLPHG